MHVQPSWRQSHRFDPGEETLGYGSLRPLPVCATRVVAWPVSGTANLRAPVLLWGVPTPNPRQHAEGLRPVPCTGRSRRQDYPQKKAGGMASGTTPAGAADVFSCATVHTHTCYSSLTAETLKPRSPGPDPRTSTPELPNSPNLKSSGP
jgi:hypothetical protein